MTLYQLRQQAIARAKERTQLKTNAKAAELSVIFADNARRLSKFNKEEKAEFYVCLDTKKRIKSESLQLLLPIVNNLKKDKIS
jgi:hypothetical protein